MVKGKLSAVWGGWHNDEHILAHQQASPRFPHLPAYDLRLEEILALPITGHHHQHRRTWRIALVLMYAKKSCR